MTGREPAQITLTVFSARNLQSKRKGETCQVSVVFGLGKNQYVTERIESHSPEWNQEAVIDIPARNQHDTIKFKVRDRDHVLGVVLLSLHSLGNQRNSTKKWLPLTPHRKGNEVFGELLVEYFVSKYRHGQTLSLSEKSSPMTSRMGSQEDISNLKKGGRFNFHRRTPSWSKASSDNTRQEDAEFATSSVRTRPSDKIKTPSPYETKKSQENPLRPLVSGVSPHEGPVQGGTKVILRGSNLGDCKASVLNVTLADVNCTSSVEYFSSSKLTVTTPPRRSPGRGPISVETVEGGIGVSSIIFAFVEVEIAVPPEVSGISPREGYLGGGQRVVLRGNNLGECKEGVIRVVIGDVDCTETLEYISPSKLIVTTLPRPLSGSGKVLVETARGGTSTCSLSFTYYVEGEPSVGEHNQTNTPIKFHNAEKSRKIQNEVDQAELKSLKQQIKDLKDDNTCLREKNQSLVVYIDNLLLSIIEAKPDLLEVKLNPNSSSTVTL